MKMPAPKHRKPNPEVRGDLFVSRDNDLSRAMLRASLAHPPVATFEAMAERRASAEASALARRVDFIEPADKDPHGFERIIGESDLTSINYLRRGMRAAAAVCRIRVPSDGGEWYGTGFLVGPRLLMTNHHVIGSIAEAGQAEAEFGYEHDLDGVLQPPVQFNLTPHEVFFANAELDVCFVSVAPLSQTSVPIERFGRLPLLPISGKSIDQEWVTIIQHPNGGPKQISIRSSRIVTLPPEAIPNVDTASFIHYLTDTEPGSSGSPVLNDQWQVVALHHKAVPAPKDDTKPDAPTVWIGNEGVRISAIYRLLEYNRFENENAARVLDRLENALGLHPTSTAAASNFGFSFEADGKAYAASRWNDANKLGYKPDFLSKTIDLDTICKDQSDAGALAPLRDGSGHLLHYRRFSVAVHKERKFAVITAVNINGKKLKHPGERKDVWRTDVRMDDVYQPAGNFYEKKRGTDKIQFSRGHMVRLLDPSWGDTLDEAKQGSFDTFHYANAAPQFQRYNSEDWGDLEDYVLDRAQTSEKKMSVFQGPIFLESDPPYGKSRDGGPWQIPQSYWKIAVIEKTAGRLAAAAFIIGQGQYLDALHEAKVFTGLNPYTSDEIRTKRLQVTIAAVEAQTGLNFSMLREYDSQGGLEATRRVRWINSADDIII
ncbi:MAG: DNA/RNA non-specific endonuclease [Beijerinckiaceae bacterium]